jgi:hypothetical protein
VSHKTPYLSHKTKGDRNILVALLNSSSKNTQAARKRLHITKIVFTSVVEVGEPEGKRPLGRPRCRWEDDIKMDLQEVGCGGMDWIGLAQERDRWRALVNAVMDLWAP